MSWLPAPSAPPPDGMVPMAGWPYKLQNQAKLMKTKQNRITASTQSNHCVQAWVLGHAAVHVKGTSTLQTTRGTGRCRGAL